MVHQGDFGGRETWLIRSMQPVGPLHGVFSDSGRGHPGANALVPPAVAPQSFQAARGPSPPLLELDHASGRWQLLAEARMEIRSDLKSSGS